MRNGGTVRFDNPDRQNAYARQYSIGYERQFRTNLGLSVDFIRSEQRNQYVLLELNPLLRNSTVVAGSQNTRTNPLVGTANEWAASVVTLVNEGYIDYSSLQVSGTKRLSNGWTGRLSYAFSRGRGNTQPVRVWRRIPNCSAISISMTRSVQRASTVRTS